MGVQLVDLHVFGDLPLSQLFHFQHLKDFLTPTTVSFYLLAVCEFYVTLWFDEKNLSEITYITTVHGFEISVTDIELANIMGWTQVEL